MGGNALKIKTCRYNAEDYALISVDVANKLNYYETSNGVGIKNTIPKSYHKKNSFGDLDVLIDTKTLGNDNIKDIINILFSPNEIFHNGSCYSFDYKQFQIDFILVKSKYFETSKIYYSYNDLGNLMGRIAAQMGFRYGHFGIKVQYYYKGKKYENEFSKDIEKIFNFLGFDYNKFYHNGFETLEDIFNFVIESKYFNPNIFDYDKLNHQNRTRNKKRDNYRKFLEYIKKENNLNYHEFSNDKDFYIKKADIFFNISLEENILQWKKEIDFDEKINEKFNGHLIMERYPELKGKELGFAIKNFKDIITKDYSSYRSDVKSKKHLFNIRINEMNDNEIWNEFAKINKLFE